MESHPIQPGRTTLVGRVVSEGRTLHIPDVLADPEYQFHEAQKIGGYRTLLGVPMLREGIPIGVIVIWREKVEPFTKKQIAQLETFADQAVIAIENVRLFQGLTESLEQQTATSEVLRIIATSPTDLQPVMDTLIANAVKLSGARQGHIREYDGELLRFVAHNNESPEQIATIMASPSRVRPESYTGRAVIDILVLLFV